MIVLNVAVFIATLPNLDYFVANYGFSVDNFLAGKYYVVLTSMFLHAGLSHLIWNMFALFVLGWVVEKRATKWQYLAAYFAAGLVGTLHMLVPFFGYSAGTAAVGASAAISGLVGLGIFMCPGKFVLFPTLLPIPFALAGAIYLLSTISNLFIPSYVAYSAHLVGFMAGSLLGFVWSKDRFKRLFVFVALLLLIVFLPTIIGLLGMLLF